MEQAAYMKNTLPLLTTIVWVPRSNKHMVAVCPRVWKDNGAGSKLSLHGHVGDKLQGGDFAGDSKRTFSILSVLEDVELVVTVEAS